MKYLIFIILLLQTLEVSSQEIDEIKKLVSPISLGQFVIKNAHTIIVLDSFDVIQLKDEYKESKDTITVPDSIIIELFTKKRDTINGNNWTYSYLPNCILVNEYGELPKYRKLLKQKKITPKSLQAELIKDKLQKWASTRFQDRTTVSISVPVFDKTKTYALLSYGYISNPLSGNSLIVLYKLENGIWVEMLTIKRYIS